MAERGPPVASPQPPIAVPALNAEQEAAARAPLAEPLMLLASAGTGKMTYLVARVLHMLERGVPPEQILYVTFTRRMAEEARARLAAAGPPGAQRVVCSTVHAFCYRLLRNYWRVAGFPRCPTPLTSKPEQLRLVTECIAWLRAERRLEQLCSWLDIPYTQHTWQSVVDLLFAKQGQLFRHCFATAQAALAAEAAARKSRQKRKGAEAYEAEGHVQGGQQHGQQHGQEQRSQAQGDHRGGQQGSSPPKVARPTKAAASPGKQARKLKQQQQQPVRRSPWDTRPMPARPAPAGSQQGSQQGSQLASLTSPARQRLGTLQLGSPPGPAVQPSQPSSQEAASPSPLPAAAHASGAGAAASPPPRLRQAPHAHQQLLMAALRLDALSPRLHLLLAHELWAALRAEHEHEPPATAEGQGAPPPPPACWRRAQKAGQAGAPVHRGAEAAGPRAGRFCSQPRRGGVGAVPAGAAQEKSNPKDPLLRGAMCWQHMAPLWGKPVGKPVGKAWQLEQIRLKHI